MADTLSADPLTGSACGSGQFLTFTLRGEEYGIEILRVQEIKGITKIRPIPNAPAYIKGAINLRGTVVPIVDLRARLGLTEAEPNQFTVIIVVSLKTRSVGLVVDAVSDVLNIAPDQIEPTLELGGDVEADFFQGMAKVSDRLVLLLDVDRLLAGDKLAVVEAA